MNVQLLLRILMFVAILILDGCSKPHHGTGWTYTAAGYEFHPSMPELDPLFDPNVPNFSANPIYAYGTYHASDVGKTGIPRLNRAQQMWLTGIEGSRSYHSRRKYLRFTMTPIANIAPLLVYDACATPEDCEGDQAGGDIVRVGQSYHIIGTRCTAWTPRPHEQSDIGNGTCFQEDLRPLRTRQLQGARANLGLPARHEPR